MRNPGRFGAWRSCAWCLVGETSCAVLYTYPFKNKAGGDASSCNEKSSSGSGKQRTEDPHREAGNLRKKKDRQGEPGTV